MSSRIFSLTLISDGSLPSIRSMSVLYRISQNTTSTEDLYQSKDNGFIQSGIMLLNPGQTQELESDELYALLEVNPSFEITISDWIFDCSAYASSNSIMEKFRTLTRQAISRILNGEQDSYEQTRAEIALFDYIRQHFSLPKTRIDDLKDQVEQYLHVHASSDCTHEQIADTFGFSPAYFSRWFSSQFGQSFLKTLSAIRVENARRALLEENGNLLHIALDAGFASLPAFNREFERIHGCTPREYRKQKQQSHLEIDRIQELLEADQSVDENVWKLELSLDQQKILFQKDFTNHLMNLGTFSALAAERKQDYLYVSLEKMGVKLVRVIHDLDLDHSQSNTFSTETQVMDQLMDHGLVPILAFEFRYIQQNTFLPALRHFLLHAANRYGRRFVSQLFIEICYDSAFDEKQVETYCRWLKDCRQTILSTGFDLPLVGPCMIPDRSGKKLRNLLDHHPDLDHVSIECSPETVQKYAGEWVFMPDTSPDYLGEQSARCRQICKSYGYESLVISQWHDLPSVSSRLQDDPGRAARVCELLLRAYGHVDSLPMPPLFDTLIRPEEKNVFSGLEGLVTSQSIAKPIVWLYSFFRHTDTYLLYFDEHILVTYDDSHYLQIICHNAKELAWQSMESGLENDPVFADERKLRFEIELKGDFAPEYVVKNRIINESNGNPAAAWRKMDIPSSFIATSELQYLRGICVPGMESNVIRSENGILNLDFVLEPNETRHIHLIALHR